MKNLLFCLLFISCSNVEEKYIPQEIETNDTITKIINDARIEKGLNSVVSEKLLTELSKQKAIQMESDKQVNHNGFTNLDIHSESVGQIVGYGFKSEVSLFENYMKSEEHRNVILGNYTHIGSCLLYTSPSPRDLSTSRMPSSA